MSLGGRVGARARASVTAAVRAARAPGTHRAPPPVVVATGPWLPGAVVRLLPAALALAAGAAAGLGEAGWLLVGVLGAALVLRPAPPTSAVVVLVAGLALLGGPDLLTPPDGAAAPAWLRGPGRLAALVVTVDLAVRATALAAQTAWRTRVEWSVLAGVARAAARSQLLVQAALWGLAGLRTAGVMGTVPEVARLAALLALGVLVALLAPRPGRPGAGG